MLQYDDVPAPFLVPLNQASARLRQPRVSAGGVSCWGGSGIVGAIAGIYSALAMGGGELGIRPDQLATVPSLSR